MMASNGEVIVGGVGPSVLSATNAIVLSSTVLLHAFHGCGGEEVAVFNFHVVGTILGSQCKSLDRGNLCEHVTNESGVLCFDDTSALQYPDRVGKWELDGIRTIS